MTDGRVVARPRPWASLPREHADALAAELPALADDVIDAVRAEVPAYSRPLEGEFGRAVREGSEVALRQLVDLLGRDEPPADLSVYRALGRTESRAGRTLDALQSAYRTGARVAWRRLVAWGEAQGLEPSVLYGLAEAIFAYVDELAAASVVGFAAEEQARAGAAQARRQALVELLARPGAAVADLQQAADLAGWRPPPRLAAVVVGADSDPERLARRLPAGTLAAWLDPLGVLVVPDPGRPSLAARLGDATDGGRAVLGPAVPWADAATSVRRARAAWPLHASGLLGASAVVRAEDHLLDLALAADRPLAADLVRRRLQAFDDLPVGARTRGLATLRAWLDAHGDVSTTATALGVHPQTVRYRLSVMPDAVQDALGDPAARRETAAGLWTMRSAASGASDVPEKGGDVRGGLILMRGGLMRPGDNRRRPPHMDGSGGGGLLPGPPPETGSLGGVVPPAHTTHVPIASSGRAGRPPHPGVRADHPRPESGGRLGIQQLRPDRRPGRSRRSRRHRRWQ